MGTNVLLDGERAKSLIRPESGSAFTKSRTPPVNPLEGDVWWRVTSDGLHQQIYMADAWRPTGACFDLSSGSYQPLKLGHGIGYNDDGAVTSTTEGSPVQAAGDIVISLEDTLPASLLELNGAMLDDGVARYPKIAARYPWMVVGGNIQLPDFQGLVLRHLDPHANRDKGASSRMARAGDGRMGAAVGTYQTDSVGAHSHDVPTNYIQKIALGMPPNDLSIGQYNTVGNPVLNGQTKVQTFGEPETRMMNIAVRYCVVAG